MKMTSKQRKLLRNLMNDLASVQDYFGYSVNIDDWHGDTEVEPLTTVSISLEFVKKYQAMCFIAKFNDEMRKANATNS